MGFKPLCNVTFTHTTFTNKYWLRQRFYRPRRLFTRQTASTHIHVIAPHKPTSSDNLYKPNVSYVKRTSPMRILYICRVITKPVTDRITNKFNNFTARRCSISTRVHTAAKCVYYRPSVDPRACIRAAPSGRTSVKFDIWVFYENVTRNSKFG